MYKLIIKLLEIKNQSKRYKEPPKRKKRKTKTHINLTKIEKFHKKMGKKGL